MNGHSEVCEQQPERTQPYVTDKYHVSCVCSRIKRLCLKSGNEASWTVSTMGFLSVAAKRSCVLVSCSVSLLKRQSTVTVVCVETFILCCAHLYGYFHS